MRIAMQKKFGNSKCSGHVQTILKIPGEEFRFLSRNRKKFYKLGEFKLQKAFEVDDRVEVRVNEFSLISENNQNAERNTSRENGAN